MNHSRDLRGAAIVGISAGIAIMVGLVLISIPGIRQERHEARRTMVLEALMRIEAAKTAYALEHDLVEGDRVSLEVLVEHENMLEQAPRLPGVDSLEVGAIGEPARATLDGEVLAPLGKAD